MENNEENKNIVDDVVIEDEDITASDIVKKLRLKLKECEKERLEYLNGWQRAKADFINFKKEEIENRKNLARIAKEEVLLDFMAIADNFEMAFANKEAWEGLPKGWRQGIEHIYAQLLGIFEVNGLKRIESEGQKFNPEEHRAIGSIEVDSEEKDYIILEELQRGYRLNGKVIRPSQVKIGVYKSN